MESPDDAAGRRLSRRAAFQLPPDHFLGDRSMEKCLDSEPKRIVACAGAFRGGKLAWDQRRALWQGWRSAPDAEMFDRFGNLFTLGSKAKTAISEACFEAAEKGDSFLVTKLVDDGADPDWRHPFVVGNPTPALVAVLSNTRPFSKVMVLKRLAAAGCDLNARMLAGPKEGKTPLALAKERRFEPEVQEALLQLGARDVMDASTDELMWYPHAAVGAVAEVAPERLAAMNAVLVAQKEALMSGKKGKKKKQSKKQPNDKDSKLDTLKKQGSTGYCVQHRRVIKHGHTPAFQTARGSEWLASNISEKLTRQQGGDDDDEVPYTLREDARTFFELLVDAPQKSVEHAVYLLREHKDSPLPYKQKPEVRKKTARKKQASPLVWRPGMAYSFADSMAAAAAADLTPQQREKQKKKRQKKARRIGLFGPGEGGADSSDSESGEEEEKDQEDVLTARAKTFDWWKEEKRKSDDGYALGRKQAASPEPLSAAGTPIPTGHRKRQKTTLAILRKAGKRGPSKAAGKRTDAKASKKKTHPKVAELMSRANGLLDALKAGVLDHYDVMFKLQQCTEELGEARAAQRREKAALRYSVFYRHEMAVKMQCLLRRRAACRERARRARERGYWGTGVPGYALVLESAGSVVKVGGIDGCRVALFVKEYSLEDRFERVAPQAGNVAVLSGVGGGDAGEAARRHALCRAVCAIVDQTCDLYSHDRVDELFARVDADGNRAVDADEFAAFVMGVGMLCGAAALSKEELDVVFDFIDTSGNGFLELEEFNAFFFHELTNRRAVPVKTFAEHFFFRSNALHLHTAKARPGSFILA